MNTSKRNKKIVVALLAGAALAACRANTEPNQVGVHVTGYDLIPTSSDVKDCQEAGKNEYQGFGDKVYLYPSGQRSFIFDNDQAKKPEAGEVSVVSKDNVTLGLSGVITFSLNTDCNTLKDFHTKIGSKLWGGKPAYFGINGGDTDEQGWINMLDVQIGNPLKNALTDDASQQNFLDLYTNATVRQQLEADLIKTMDQRVKDLTGGDYFKITGVLLNKPTAPQSITDALTNQQAAVQQNQAQKLQNETAITQYQQVQACKALGISETTCVTLYGINSGKITVLPVPVGSSVIVNGSQTPTK